MTENFLIGRLLETFVFREGKLVSPSFYFEQQQNGEKDFRIVVKITGSFLDMTLSWKFIE